MNLSFPYKNSTVSYSDQGKGPVLILLHGFLENKEMWQPLLGEFLKKNRVIRIDLLGHGKTGNLGYVHTMEDQADLVLALARSLRLRKFKLIGHSMGGYVALAIADKRGQAISGLCLLNSTPVADSPEKRTDRDRTINTVKKNYKTFINIAIPNLFAPANQVRLKAQILAVKNEALAMDIQGVVAALEGMKIRTDRTELFKKASYKKLMLIGAEDPVLDKVELLAQAVKTGAKSIVLTGGHMSHLEDQVGVIMALKKFI